MKIWLVIVLWLCAVMPVSADPLDERLAGFALETHLRGQFTETWAAGYLDEPLVSQGELEYRAPGILVKQIISPDMVTQTIIGDVVTISRNGEKQQASLSNSPEMALGIEALRDLLEGNRAGLDNRFTVQYQAVSEIPQVWNMKLIPRDEKLNRQISWIAMKGRGNRLHEIHLEYVNGDKMVTRIIPHE